jgi:DNA repair protein RadC
MENILEALIGEKNAAKLLKDTTFEQVLLMQESEIQYRTNKRCATIIAAAKKLHAPLDTKTMIRESDDILKIKEVYELKYLDHEQFRVVFLRRNNTVILTETICTGGYASTVCETRAIWRKALELKATGIILVHNHPSGCETPSDADNKITARIKEQSRIMDINLLDHLIITSALGKKPYYSYVDASNVAIF